MVSQNFALALWALFFLVGCSSSKSGIDFWEGKFDYTLGLNRVQLSESDQKKWKAEWKMAQELSAQMIVLEKVFSDTSLIHLEASHWFLRDVEGRGEVLFGNWRDSVFYVQSAMNPYDSMGLRIFRKEFHLAELDGILKEIANSERTLEAMKVSDFEKYVYLMLGSSNRGRIYWVAPEEKGQLNIGGIWKFGFDKQKFKTEKPILLGELSRVYPEELRSFNFRVVDWESIPDAGVLYQVLRNQEAFPTQYLHTGKYLFAYVPDQKGGFQWIVLDPKGDERFRLREPLR